ncbi:MAG TPA: hypothetical protein VGN52_20935 [Burkholderiales bacterium]|jgi:hypothetical protein
MKTTVKALIAGAAAAAAVTFSAGASAETIFQAHERHKAELLNFLGNVTASINIGPAYAPPVYVAPAPVYSAPPVAYVEPGYYRGPRGYERDWHNHRDYYRHNDGRYGR